MHRSVYNFNKELLFGECGAFIFANGATLILSHFTHNNKIISGGAVVSTLIGGGLFWLIMRIYDRMRDTNFKAKEITSDIGYFTPAALIVGTFVYDPILYFVSNYLLRNANAVELSVITGQIIAFSCFLFCMNIYRILLIKFKVRKL